MSTPIRILCERADDLAISALVPHKKNPNKHSEEQIERLAALIRYHGFRHPIIVSKRSGFIVAGHGRLEAARRLGMAKVPVDYQDFESDEAEYAFLVADNSIALWAELDLAAINLEVPNLGSDFDIDMLGIKDFTIDVAEKSDEDPDAVPEPPKVAKTKRGELWLLGEHRLLVGDSTDKADVDRLMAGQTAAMVFTDPPYGVSYQKDMSAEEASVRNRRKDGKIVSNDELTGDKLFEFLRKAFAAWPLPPGGVWYVCSPPGSTELVFRQALGDELRECIVWVKDQFVFGRQDYHWRHESILYGWRPDAAHYFIDDRTQDTVWEIPRPKRSEEHPTMKPIELVEKAIQNSSLRGGIVFDGFCGSGTTILAAARTGRRGFGIEYAPEYADVILARWAKYTGKDPISEDGRKWSEVNRGA